MPTDASNMYDEEVSPNEQQDFSDDEEERQAKKKKRNPNKKSENDGNSERKDGEYNQGGDSNKGRGRGQDSGRGPSKGRGRSHGNGSWNSPHQIQPPQRHAQYLTSTPLSYHNAYQSHQTQQVPPPPPTYSYAPWHLPQHQGMYQPQQCQQQYQQQPAQYGASTQFLPTGHVPHGVPPPPPPPRPPMNFPASVTGVPVQFSQPQQSNGSLSYPPQQQTSESDTVYYNYSGS